MIYGLIICAGKQSRFNLEKPKALMPYNNEMTLLDKNILQMSSICDKVFVVCSFDNYEYFKHYSPIVIKSGKGCGEAVLSTLKIIQPIKDDICCIQWGDALAENDTIYKTLQENYNNKILVPCVIEEKPYVEIKYDGNKVNSVLFSKHGDETTKGYHDLSIFYGNALLIKNTLLDFWNKYYNSVNDLFEYKHRNEMEFLDIFNEYDLPSQVVDIKNFNMLAFNTLEEYQHNIKNI